MSTKPTEPMGSSRSRIFDEDDFKGRLIDEYKILQDKIDKIGSFRFTIKGWSVTAVIAATAAAGTTQRLLTVMLITLSLAVMILFFFFFEFEQVKLSRLFGERARKLESSFKLIDRNIGTVRAAPIPVPYTAHTIARANYRESIRKKAISARQFSVDEFSQEWSNAWRIWRQADVCFYAVLLMVALLPLFPRYGAIELHWKKLMGTDISTSTTTIAPPSKTLEGSPSR